MEEEIFAAAYGLAMTPGIGARHFQILIKRFGNAQTIWQLPDSELHQALPEALASAIISQRRTFDAQPMIAELRAAACSAVALGDPRYPTRLAAFDRPPPILFYRGNAEAAQCQTTVALVGARAMSSYGQRVANKFAADLAQAGCTIISGLALGIDSVAHQATLAAGGCTIAVTGGGLDTRMLYPRSNSPLAQKIIAQGGALFSLQSPLTKAEIHHFPQRNIIIAGLADLTIVVEGKADSGALITARAALDNHREVGAVPGAIDSLLSAGPHALITAGAQLMSSAADALAVLGLQPLPEKPLPNIAFPSSTAEKIFKLLLAKTQTSDDLVRSLQLPAAAILTSLQQLELLALAKEAHGQWSAQTTF